MGSQWSLPPQCAAKVQHQEPFVNTFNPFYDLQHDKCPFTKAQNLFQTTLTTCNNTTNPASNKPLSNKLITNNSLSNKTLSNNFLTNKFVTNRIITNFAA